jgi:hypothetical protein
VTQKLALIGSLAGILAISTAGVTRLGRNLRAPEREERSFASMVIFMLLPLLNFPKRFLACSNGGAPNLLTSIFDTMR